MKSAKRTTGFPPSLAATATGAAASTGNIIEQPMVAPAPKRGDRLTRSGTSSGQAGQIVTAANRWRENYNPLRALTMRRAVELLELGQRGDYAYLQWAFRFIERRYPTLSALVTRCEAPLKEFDWQIKIKATLPKGATPEQAEAQKGSLVAAYERVDNLRAAMVHLHSADFRGYAHLQKHRAADGSVCHFEPLNQWCVCRDGLEGNWFWNPDSRSTSQPLTFLGKEFAIGGENLPIEDFVVRECARPIDEIGLIGLIRSNLAEKDWDGFLEIYGIPGGVVTMPSNVPSGKETEYEAAAKLIAEGGSGALPNGSDYKPNDAPRGVDPFTPRLKHLDEQLVMAGTGGRLTMLAESGSGTLAGGAHESTFNEIANGRAREISELMQAQFDVEVLEREHPGEPALVYFLFGDEEEEASTELCKNVLTLSQAGKKVETAWLSEKLGYPIEEAEEPEAADPEQTSPDDPDAVPIMNRRAVWLILNDGGNPNHDEGGKFASGPDLAAFHDKSLGPGGQDHQVVAYRAVDAAEAERVKAETGIDVSGHTHAVDNYALRHIHSEHGNPAREMPRGQVAVTREDIAALPETISKADTIEHAGRTGIGREGIRYTRKSAGTTVVVEEVRTKRKQLVPVSIVKFKNRATIDAGKPTPTSTASPLRPERKVMRNREEVKAGQASVATAVAEDLSHVFARLEKIIAIEDDGVFTAKLQAFLDDFPKLKQDLLADPSAARALQPVIAGAFLQGLKGKQ